MTPGLARICCFAAGLALGVPLLGPPGPAAAQGRYQPQGAAQRHFAAGEQALAAADAARAAGDAAAARARAADAADAFERAFDADPAFLEAYAKFGLATYTTGESERAVGLLREGLEVNPDSPEIQFWLGNHLLRAGRPPEGLPLLERVARSSDAFPEADLVLGTHYYKQNELPRAAAALEKYLATRPDDIAARGTLGNAYFKLEKYREAQRAFEEVRRASPDNIQVQINLGTCHYQLGEYARAVELLEGALAKEPRRESVVFNLAQALFQWKKYDQSVPYYRQFVAQKPDSFNGHYFLGSALLELGPSHEAEALAALTAAIRLKPEVAIAHYKVGLLHLRRGALAEAERAFAAARARAPGDPWAVSALGTVARRRGDLDLAATLHQQAADAAPDQARLQANLGLTRLARGQVAEAEAAVARAAAADRADPFVRQAATHLAARAARRLLGDGDAAGAEARLRAALALDPDGPGAAALQADLGLALATQGKPAEASTAAEVAVRLSAGAPDAAAVRAAHARVLLAAGRAAEARAALEATPAAAETAAGAAVLGAATLKAGEPQAALAPLVAARRLAPADAATRHNLGLALLARAARTARDAREAAAGADDLKTALELAAPADGAPDAALLPRAAYLGLVLALRRIDAAAAATWLGRLGGLKEPVAWLPGAPPGHLDYLAAYAQFLAKRDDRAVALLEHSRALRNRAGPEARLLMRALARQADKAYTTGDLGEAARNLKSAAALGHDAVVENNLAALELRTNRKAKVEARLRAVSGQVPEAWFNLGVALDALGRHEDAYKAYLRSAQSGGAYAARARDLAEAKRRIFGFAP